MDGRTEDERHQLRREADDDERRASELAEDDPTYSGYLERRAAHKRMLARTGEIYGD